LQERRDTRWHKARKVVKNEGKKRRTTTRQSGVGCKGQEGFCRDDVEKKVI
jgi:hypothetical protein